LPSRARIITTNIRPGPGVYEIVASDVVEIGLSRAKAEVSPEARIAGLFDAHHVRLYGLARRLTASSDAARDLVQETFLRVARSPGSVPSGATSEEAWLVRILVNLCRDQWRRTSSRRRLTVQYQDEIPKTASDRTEAALIAEDIVWRALRELPPRRRTVIILYELDNVAIPEIARMLGVSAITVRWHLSRGRQELARVIEAKS
jgi:RNA polymerase sigma-70 factor (ECF subfamily)